MTTATPVRHPDHLLTPVDAIVLFIDYQPEQVSTVGSQPHADLMLNAVTVAKAAIAFDIPVVLSTVGVELGANSVTIDELSDALPGVSEIDRTTMNSWEDHSFRAAVERTGRRKVVICGLWTEVCVAFPTLDLLEEGYEVYPVADAIGGVSPNAHNSAMERMCGAGAKPISALAFACELQRDWARGHGDKLRNIMRWYFTERSRH
jgi:nicotinamidase-related amidase